MWRLLIFILFALTSFINCDEMKVVMEGEEFELEFDSRATLNDLIGQIGPLGGKIYFEWDANDPTLKAYVLAHSVKAHGEYLGHPRNYQAVVNSQEKGDIRFIITTLANKSLISIAKQRSNLELAGDRIDHIHPLKFLEIVFLDEELKVGIRNIRGRGWIWNDFVVGISKCFSTEAGCDNLRGSDVATFAKALEVDLKEIELFFQLQDWENLVDTLITLVPRKGDHGRYDS